jgi:hypothetical protein
MHDKMIKYGWDSSSGKMKSWQASSAVDKIYKSYIIIIITWFYIMEKMSFSSLAFSRENREAPDNLS